MALKPEEPRFPEYLAALFMRARRVDDGIRVARDGLVKFPQAIRLHIVLGYLLEKKDFDESIRTMQRVLDLDPKNAEALNFIGYGWADRGIRLPEAEQMIRAALDAQPDDGNITDSLGWVLFKQGKFAEALEVLKKAVEMSPGVAEIRDHLGDAYEATADLEKAVATWRQALELNPDPDLRAAIEKKLRDHPAGPAEPPRNGKKAGKKSRK
jgi:tetratricopeptide (TPR) repeat protein